MAKLLLMGPAGEVQREYDLGDYNTLGRHPDQSIQLLDRVVSKEHALVVRRDGRFVITDLGSRNGSFVNSVRITGPVYLTDGDELSMGSSRMIFGQKAEGDGSMLRKVTISPEVLETNIQSRLARATEGKFLPEKQIHDTAQLRRDYEKLRIANELSRALGMERDLEKVYQIVLDKAFDIFRADRGVILVLDEKTNELNPSRVKARDVQSQEEGIKLSSTVIKEVLDKRSAVLSSDASVDSRFSGAHSVILQGIRSTMSVPLMFEDRLLGVIHLDNLMSSGAFTEKDLQLLTGFASQAAVAIENSNLTVKIREEAVVRSELGKLLSPNLVEQVVAGNLQVKKGGEQRRCTVLFSDIRGFTAWSENTPAPEIVACLNDYFEIMVDLVFKYEGTLDKFVGDELMAVWGAPVARPDDPIRACRSAVEMMIALAEFNQTRAAEGDPPLRIGIGVNTGDMVSGYIGSSATLDYTVIGDAVNLGARLCGAAAAGEILIADGTMNCVTQQVVADPREPIMVKGKAAPIPIYNITGIR